MIGNFCFGPVLTAGVLDVFGVGAQARASYWGIGFDYQFFGFSTQDIPIQISLLTIEGRLYPFGNAFFISGGVAWQHASLSGKVSYQDSRIGTITTDVKGRVSVPVFKLGIGFLGRAGFVLGIDLAFGIQLGSNTVEFSTDLPRIQEVMDAEEKVRKRADAWVRALPFLLQLNLLRIGYLF